MLKRKEALNKEPKFGPHLAMSLGGASSTQTCGLAVAWEQGGAPADHTSMGAKACSYPEDATPTPTGPPIGIFPIPGVSHGCDTEPPSYDL